MHEHCVLVLFAMSTSHDFGKCCALASLSLLVVSERY